MGFWDKAFDVAKNAGTAVANKLEESANETRELRLKYEGAGDEELLQVVHSGSGFFSKSPKEKAVAFSILKARGLSIEEINALKP